MSPGRPDPPASTRFHRSPPVRLYTWLYALPGSPRHPVNCGLTVSAFAGPENTGVTPQVGSGVQVNITVPLPSGGVTVGNTGLVGAKAGLAHDAPPPPPPPPPANPPPVPPKPPPPPL